MTPLLFLTQILGFLLQTFPIGVLCFAPFEDNALRYARRRVYLGLFWGLTLAALGFAAFVTLFFDPHASINTPLVLAQNIYMSVTFLIACAVYVYVVRATAVQKGLILLMLIHYAAVLFTTLNVLLGVWTREMEFAAYRPYGGVGLIIQALLLVLTLPLVVPFLRRTVRESMKQLSNTVLRRGCVYFAVALALYCLCVAAIANIPSVSNHMLRPLALFLVVVIGTDAALYVMFFNDVRLAAQNTQLQAQLRSFDDQYRQISSAAEDYRRLRHDMRHHFGVISVYNQEGQRDELAAYLKRYADSVDNIENQPLSGYLALDAVLRYYLARARDEHISVALDLCHLPAHLDFAVTDITVLFGNLLENAIHACQLLPEEARHMRLSLRQSNVSLLIFVENTCLNDGIVQKEYGPETFLLKSAHHSQGLRCIRLAVEKYSGRVEYKKENGRFCVRVVINIPDNTLHTSLSTL